MCRKRSNRIVGGSVVVCNGQRSTKILIRLMPRCKLDSFGRRVRTYVLRTDRVDKFVGQPDRRRLLEFLRTVSVYGFLEPVVTLQIMMFETDQFFNVQTTALKKHTKPKTSCFYTVIDSKTWVVVVLDCQS
jgi:hypothetical protein